MTRSSPPAAVMALGQCPVTDRARGVSPPAGHDTGPLRPNLFHFDGRDHSDSGGYGYKLPWTAYVDGELKMAVHRLDAPGWGKGKVMRVGAESPVPGVRGYFAGSVWVPAAGCWQVTGTIDRISVTFVFRAG